MEESDSFLLGLAPRGVLSQLLKDPTLASFLDRSSFGLPESQAKIGQPGLFKNEIPLGREISAICCLSPKCYCFLTRDQVSRTLVDTVKRSKGMKTRLLQRHIRFQHYLECLKHETLERVPVQTFYSIESKNAALFFREGRKVPLTLFDAKQAWKSCNLCSMPFPYRSADDHTRDQCPLFFDMQHFPQGQ